MIITSEANCRPGGKKAQQILVATRRTLQFTVAASGVIQARPAGTSFAPPSRR